jgi:hypothetical protein
MTALLVANIKLVMMSVLVGSIVSLAYRGTNSRVEARP